MSGDDLIYHAPADEDYSTPFWQRSTPIMVEPGPPRSGYTLCASREEAYAKYGDGFVRPPCELAPEGITISYGQEVEVLPSELSPIHMEEEGAYSRSCYPHRTIQVYKGGTLRGVRVVRTGYVVLGGKTFNNAAHREVLAWEE